MDISREDLDGLSVLKPVGDLTNHLLRFRKAQQAVLDAELPTSSSISVRSGFSAVSVSGKLCLPTKIVRPRAVNSFSAPWETRFTYLETTGLMTVFTVCESLEEAIASL